MFKTLDEFKAAAEFFPSGRIVPQRILKTERKHKSRVVFGSDAWAMPTPKGYLIASDTRKSGSYLVTIKHIKTAHLYGSPYTPGGCTQWIGNSGIDDAQQLDDINRIYKHSHSFNTNCSEMLEREILKPEAK